MSNFQGYITKLISDGFLIEELISEGLVRKKLLSLTEKGKAYLNEKGFDNSKKIAGAEHEYWKMKIKAKLESEGNQVKEEAPAKDGDKEKVH